MRYTSTIWAPLAEIRMSNRSTRSLSAATVERYRVWLEQGREAPPVRLARNGDGYVVRDGRHRVAAALAAGFRFIEAEVRPIGPVRRLVMAVATRTWATISHRDRGRDSGRLQGSSQSGIRTRGFRTCRQHGDALWERLSLAPSRAWVRFPPSPSANAAWLR